MLEIYDKNSLLLLQEYTLVHCCPNFAPNHSMIGSKEIKKAKLFIWWNKRKEGALSSGIYYVGVGFPFEKGIIYSSDIVEWHLK